MQLLPETGEGIARSTGGSDFVEADLRDPEINVRYGTWYLDYLRDRYDGDVATALAAYHAGPGERRRVAPQTGAGSRSRRRVHTSTRSSASGRSTAARTASSPTAS